MKYTFIIPVFLAFHSMAQIDYSAHPETISSANVTVRVDWLRSTPRNCQIDFNHLVNFINVNNDQTYNSKVNVELYHNNTMIRSFTFPTGDHITNRIYVGEAINLKKGDKVYFLLQLNPETDSEEYVFNIREDPRAAIKTVSIVKQQLVAESKEKEKHKKPKRYTVGWIGRNIFNIQEPIGHEN